MSGRDTCKTVDSLNAMGNQDKEMLNKKQKMWFCKSKKMRKRRELLICTWLMTLHVWVKFGVKKETFLWL